MSISGMLNSRITVCVRCMVYITRAHTTNPDLPRITMPHQTLERLNKKKSMKKKVYYEGSPIISCHRKKFNHYKGQKSADSSGRNLASSGWKHYKSVGDHFTINPRSSNPALWMAEESRQYRDFSLLGLHPRLVEGLADHNIRQPTNIQALTIPVMMRGSNVLCTAETGSGKTLAYLLPILQKVNEHKALYGDHVMNTPYAIIVAPCRELADQIQSVASVFSPYLSCSSISHCGGRGTTHLIRWRHQQESDLLIVTPGVLRKLLLTRVYSQSRLMHVVFDEADTLLDDSFQELTVSILNLLKITSEKLLEQDGDDVGGTQVALVSATLPTSIEDVLSDTVPMDTIEKVATSHVHHLLPHVAHKFVRVNGSTKVEQFKKLIQANQKKPTIVFCKDSKTACFVSYMLEEDGINNVAIHGNMSQKVRNGRFDQLQSGETNILVATDIVSRGLDTIKVERIVNYDLPSHLSDYIHRSGRVGRVGSLAHGTVTSFVQHGYEVETLWRIEAAARSMSKLKGVNANIKRKHSVRHDRLQQAQMMTSVV